MSYLEQLKARDDFCKRGAPGSVKSIETPIGEHSDTFDTTQPGPFQKIESGSVSFDTTQPGPFQKKRGEVNDSRDGEELHKAHVFEATAPASDFPERGAPPTDKTAKTPDRPSWRWLVTHPDGTVTDHTVTPPDTLEQMERAYPGAVGFEPLYHRTPAMEVAA